MSRLFDSFRSFFFFCGGVDPRIAHLASTETVNLAGRGMAVLISSGLATVSWSHFFSTSLGMASLPAILSGLACGLAVFGLDRWIVGSARKKDNAQQEILAAIPRFALAALVGAMVSDGLIQKFFHGEIESQMARERAAIRQQTETSIAARPAYQEMSVLEGKIAVARSATDAARAAASGQEDLATAEAQGRAVQSAEGTAATTGRLGDGPIARYRRFQAEQTRRDAEEIERRNDALVAPLQKRLDGLVQRRDAELAAMSNLDQMAIGPLARTHALEQLCRQYPELWGKVVFWWLTIFVIDSLPALVKLSHVSHKLRPYDDLMEIWEEKEIATGKERVQKAIDADVQADNDLQAQLAALNQTSNTTIITRLGSLWDGLLQNVYLPAVEARMRAHLQQHIQKMNRLP